MSYAKIQQILYWAMRLATFSFGTVLAVMIVLRLISAIFIPHPLYREPYQEGMPFRLWEVILCMIIFTPYKWTIKSPSFDIRASLVFAQIILIYGSGFISSSWVNLHDNQILLHPISVVILLFLWITMLMKRNEFNEQDCENYCTQ